MCHPANSLSGRADNVWPSSQCLTRHTASLARQAPVRPSAVLPSVRPSVRPSAVRPPSVQPAGRLAYYYDYYYYYYYYTLSDLAHNLSDIFFSGFAIDRSKKYIEVIKTYINIDAVDP